MLGLPAISGLLVPLGMIFRPDTPRWLLERGRVEDARAVLRRIRGNASVEGEFKEIQQTLTQATERGKFSDLLTPAVRPALIVGVGLAIFQQVTGINTVIYYAPQIIQKA